MKLLLVIDMQEDYVGEFRNKKVYPYDSKNLIKIINARISQYPSESVIYITNRFFWEKRREAKKLVDKLLIVSTSIFEKRKASCFSNEELIHYLQKIHATELELVGVDGNYCVGASALDGVKRGFQILVNESCVGIGNPKKYLKTRRKLEKSNVGFGL